MKKLHLNWLSDIPIKEHILTQKGAFREAIRHGWKPTLMHHNWVSGKSFTLEHVLSCTYDGFPMLRHIITNHSKIES